MKPKIIIINGTSCAGKSSVAGQLKNHLGNAFCYLTWDSFLERIASKKDITDQDKKDLVNVFIQEVSAQAESGGHLILDIVCVPASTFQRLTKAFEKFDLFTIRMRASIEELERRELSRADRMNGQARAQHIEMFHKQSHPKYDLEIDSTRLNPEEITQLILNELQNPTKPLKKTILNRGFKI